MKIRTVVAMAAMLLSANAANATTYVGSLVAGGTTTDFTIDTDGTLGALSLANLTSWSGVISQGSNSVAIGSALSGVFVNQGANGSGLFATASQLTFDPTLNQVGFLLGRGVSGTFAYICITGQATNCNGVSSAIVLAFDQNVGNVEIGAGDRDFCGCAGRQWGSARTRELGPDDRRAGPDRRCDASPHGRRHRQLSRFRPGARLPQR